jgi:hypothetical protein
MAAAITGSLLRPSRIESLGRIELRIVEHTDETSTREFTIQVYPFERVLSLKQRIAETYGRDSVAHLPEYMFIAQSVAGETGWYAPLEFSWNIARNGYLRDPLLPDVVGVPDKRLFDAAGSRLADKHASEHMGMLLEDLVDIATFREVHIWSLDTIAKAAGIYDPSTEIVSDMLEGYFKLYFPRISQAALVQDFSRRPDAGETDDAGAALAYHTELDKRLVVLDSLLPKLRQSCVLSQLYRVLYYIHPNPEFTSSADLELAFYEAKLTEQIPFVRYFPGNQRSSAPLVKLAKSDAGVPLIEQMVLSKMLRDIPEMDEEETKHGVLLYKIPVIAPRVPAETMWTFTLFGYDGSATLTLQASRRDDPLSYEAVSAAMSILPAILTVGRIDPVRTPLVLKELNATYHLDVSDLGLAVPTIKSLESRIDLFQSFVSKTQKLESQRTSLTLRYKTVSNYVKESNPIFDHLTRVTLDKGRAGLLSDEDYIQELATHFGYSRAFAASYVSQWAALHSELVSRGKSILDTVNPGAFIGVYANHPKYDFILSNIQSQRDLERILSCMSVFVSHPTDDLVVAKSRTEMESVAEVMADVEHASTMNAADAATTAAMAAQESGQLAEEGGMDELMLASLAGMGIEEEELAEVGAAIAEERIAPAPAVEEVKPPTDISRIKYAKEDTDHLSRLYQHDSRLFKYKVEKDVKPYVKSCQSTPGRQPNVMSLSQYRRARELYKDTVTWVEGPLSEKDQEAVVVASKAVGSRTIGGRNERTIYELELKTLALGFPLKDNKSIIETAKGKKEMTEEEQAEIKRRIEVQKKSPPLWIVYRLGTSSEEGTHTNYYICSEYWCLYDNLPILPTIFEDGQINACPFCGGTLITNPNSPGMGETVLKRRNTIGLHKFVGFMGEMRHPDGYAQPCCFTTPDSVVPPAGAKPFPSRQLELPPHQAAAEAAAELKAVVPKAPAPAPAKAPAKAAEEDIDETSDGAPKPTVVGDPYRDRPFTAKRDKVKKNEWYIPHQKIVGRTNEGWVDITPKFRGIVSVPPQTVNTLLQQDPEVFLTAIRGVQAKSQNSYLAVPGRAFVRYGLGTDATKPGENLFSLVAFADYATSFLHDEHAEVSMRSGESVLNFMTSDDPIVMRRMMSVFEQANYGTLFHEFTVPQVELLDDQIVGFENWWKHAIGRPKGPSDKKYAIQTYLAFENFKAYVKDVSMKKDLRYFMSFFSTPKLLTSQGFIPIVIQYYRKNTPATIMCPEFGVSFYHQPVETRPPLLFVVHDVETGIFDPLVVYEGVKLADGTEEQRVLGLIHPRTPMFARLSPEFRSSIQGFIEKYFSVAANGGCGVDRQLTHPWMPVRDTSKIPRLSELIHVLDLEHKKHVVVADDDDGVKKKLPRDRHVLTGDIRKEALYRDPRSNRLLGVIVRHSHPRRYVLVPCIDDGYIHPASARDAIENVRGDLFDENATYKLPTFDDIFFVLTGKQKTVDETRLAGHFEAYLPVKLIEKMVINPDTGVREPRFVAVELACGIWIPAQPARASEVREIRGKYMEKALSASGASAPVDQMPWNLNATVLGPEKSGAESVAYTSEEELDESYQLFRVAFSEWLRDNASVREQIELLRRARNRLPLFELQKRLEILITAIVNPTNPNQSWFTTAKGQVSRPIYRRNCLKLKHSECSGGCMWVPLGNDTDTEDEGRCLIHTQQTERYIQPVETLIARLVDELLRTFSLADEILSARVPRLPSLQSRSIEHEDDTLLFSLPGRGDDDLYTQLGYKGRKPTEYTQGIMFPEETSLPGEFEEGDIPGDTPGSWSAVFRHVLLGEELARSDRLKFQTIVSQISGMPIDKYEAHVGHPVIGTESDWKELSEQRKVNIIFTHVDTSIQLLQPYRVLRVEDSEKYIVLDNDQVPFQHKIKAGAFIVHITDLPAPIRSWLATQGVRQPEFPTSVGPVPVAVAPPPAVVEAAEPKIAKAAAKPVKRRIKYPVGKTRDDGNCFFSAIFRAAKERGKAVVERLATCLGVSAATESKFIAEVRNKIAARIETGHLPSGAGREGPLNMYDVFMEMVASPNDFKARISAYPTWFKETFGDAGEHIGTREEFARRLAEQIRTDKNWVSEIEVYTLQEMLAPCEFALRITNSNLIRVVGELKATTDDGKILLNIYNKGEAHYEYFKMEADADDE